MFCNKRCPTPSHVSYRLPFFFLKKKLVSKSFSNRAQVAGSTSPDCCGCPQSCRRSVGVERTQAAVVLAKRCRVGWLCHLLGASGHRVVPARHTSVLQRSQFILCKRLPDPGHLLGNPIRTGTAQCQRQLARAARLRIFIVFFLTTKIGFSITAIFYQCRPLAESNQPPLVAALCQRCRRSTVLLLSWLPSAPTTAAPVLLVTTIAEDRWLRPGYWRRQR